MYRNPALMIVGQPDGVDPAKGLMVPIEFKMHRTCRLMTCLNWRSTGWCWPRSGSVTTNRLGDVVLRREGMPVSINVEIPRHRIARVLELLR